MIADVMTVVTSPEVSKIDTAIQLPCDELDHMEISTGEPLPRCVFGGPPTPQEAKDATSELTDALQKYMNCNDGPRTTEFRINHDRKDILHRVELLAKTPKFQSIAASIACDPIICNAVMNNPEVVEFRNRWQKRNTIPALEMISFANKIAGKLDFIYDEPVKNLSLFWRLRDRVTDLAQIVKTRAVVMVSDLSKHIYNKFHTSSGVGGGGGGGVGGGGGGVGGVGGGGGVDDPSVESSFMDTYGETLVKLAIIVIMIVIFKRKI